MKTCVAVVPLKEKSVLSEPYVPVPSWLKNNLPLQTVRFVGPLPDQFDVEYKSTASVVPCVVPSVDHSSHPEVGLLAEKYNLPLKIVK